MTKTRPFLSMCYGDPSATEVPPCCETATKKLTFSTTSVLLLLNMPLSLSRATIFRRQKNPRRVYRPKIAGILFVCNEPEGKYYTVPDRFMGNYSATGRANSSSGRGKSITPQTLVRYSVTYDTSSSFVFLLFGCCLLIVYSLVTMLKHLMLAMENQLFYRQIYYTIWKRVMCQEAQWNESHWNLPIPSPIRISSGNLFNW